MPSNRIADHPFQARRKLRVLGIGGGPAGIYLAIRGQQRFQDIELVIYEKADRVGGVWRDNTYPGCQCDVPSHIYSYTFQPDSEWPTYYASSANIYKYFDKTATQYHAKDYIKLNSKVTACVWDEEKAGYNVTIEDMTSPVDAKTGRHREFHDFAHNIIWQGGNLSQWKMPDIEGFNEFQGKVMHTANFDNTYDLNNKKLAVIGGGSSGVQVLPAVQKVATRVDAYMRSKAWISLPMVSKKSIESGHRGENFDYSAEEMDKFRGDPTWALQYRLDMENDMNTFFSICLRDSQLQKRIRQDCEDHMRRKLAKKPELIKMLIPDFGVGCRRITPGPGFLEALCEDNVDVVQERIAKFDKTGIIDATGKHREVDAIICATGFNTSFRPPFRVVGREGHELDEEYAKDPRSYLSVALPNFPNFWIINGPQGCGANGSILPVLETTQAFISPHSAFANQMQSIDYCIEAINKMQRQNIAWMQPKPDVVEDFNNYTDQFIEEKGVWSDNCSSWYKGGRGGDARVIAVFPASNVAFMECLSDPRWEDYEYKYTTANRFRAFGSGHAMVEAEGRGRSNHFKDRLHTVDDLKIKYGIPIDQADLGQVSAAAPPET